MNSSEQGLESLPVPVAVGNSREWLSPIVFPRHGEMIHPTAQTTGHDCDPVRPVPFIPCTAMRPIESAGADSPSRVNPSA